MRFLDVAIDGASSEERKRTKTKNSYSFLFLCNIVARVDALSEEKKKRVRYNIVA